MKDFLGNDVDKGHILILALPENDQKWHATPFITDELMYAVVLGYRDVANPQSEQKEHIVDCLIISDDLDNIYEMSFGASFIAKHTVQIPAFVLKRGDTVQERVLCEAMRALKTTY